VTRRIPMRIHPLFGSLFGRYAMACVAMMAMLLSSCGADQVAGIEGSGAPVAAAPVTTNGRITGFGSIIVDDVEYATTGAQIRIDDQVANETDLRVGHIVTIRGTVSADGRTGTASEVMFTSDVRGDVGQVNASARTFSVLGQTVRVNDETLFDEGTQIEDLSQLQAGAKVRVSGFKNAAGEVLASRVDGLAPAATNQEAQVSGQVQSLDTNVRTFRINTLQVDYRSATVSGNLVEGSTATVKGTSGTGAAAGTLVATQITVTSGSPAPPAGEKAQIEGLISAFQSVTDFTVAGRRVTTNGNTRFQLRGLTLGVDVFVKVRGTYNASQILVADRVEARELPRGLVRGPVDAVSAGSGTLGVLGVNVQVSGSTSFEDRSNEHVRQFRLSDIRSGDSVEVRGTVDPSGSLLATLVQRNRPEQRVQVQGAARDVAAPMFRVLGVTVMTDSRTTFPGLGNGGAEAFFSRAADRQVNVRGTLSGNTLVADQVRLVGGDGDD
jgi:hypothetical protein